MTGEITTEWFNNLIERCEVVGQCLVLLREIAEREEKAAERSERAAEREAKNKERGKEVKLKELQIKEKELDLKKTFPHESTTHDITDKVKLPKFIEGQDIEVFLTSFERLATAHKWRLIP